jgi:hypothetical protein
VGIEPHHVEQLALGRLEAKPLEQVGHQGLIPGTSQAHTNSQTSIQAVGPG